VTSVTVLSDMKVLWDRRVRRGIGACPRKTSRGAHALALRLAAHDPLAVGDGAATGSSRVVAEPCGSVEVARE